MNPMTIEERLRALEDREAIRELRAQYCALVDDGRYDELVDRLFAADASCDFRAADDSLEPMISRGREEIRRFFKEQVDVLLRDMSHTVHNHRITLDGDEARGDCAFELTAIDATNGGEIVGAGRYLDRYRRIDGTWRFAERNARMVYIAPAAGWARRRFVATLPHRTARRAGGSAP